jgi:hypothetical protein
VVGGAFDKLHAKVDPVGIPPTTGTLFRPIRGVGSDDVLLNGALHVPAVAADRLVLDVLEVERVPMQADEAGDE